MSLPVVVAENEKQHLRMRPKLLFWGGILQSVDESIVTSAEVDTLLVVLTCNGEGIVECISLLVVVAENEEHHKHYES